MTVEAPERPPVARLDIHLVYHAPLAGQSTSKITVEARGLIGDEKTEFRNQWTVWSDGEPGKLLADGVIEDLSEAVREWAPIAEAAQCKIWRHELSQRLLAEIAESPDGPTAGQLRQVLAELDSQASAIPRSRPTPACRQLLAGLDRQKVEHAAWSVIRHAKKTGDIHEEADLVDQILDAVLADMKESSV